MAPARILGGCSWPWRPVETVSLTGGRKILWLSSTTPSMDSITSSMNAISYTAARENTASTMDRVCSDHTPVIITRNRDQSVVMLSLEDFEALEETAYLIRSPANAKRLLEAIHALEGGKGVVREIDLNA